MTLARFEVRWANTIGRALLPPGFLGGVVDDTDIGEGFAADVARAPWEAGFLGHLVLWMIWFSPLWRRARLRTFGGVSLEDRVSLLEDMLKMRPYILRMAVTMLKLTLCTVLLGDRRFLARLGAYGLKEEPAVAAPADERHAS